MREFVVITAMLMLLALPADAQESTLPSPPGADWSPALREALFADEATMTLRDEADARARLDALSPEDQAKLRAECEASRSEETDGAAAGAAATETAASDPAAPDPAASDPAAPSEFDSSGTGTEGSPVPAGAVSLSHLVQVCGWVLDPVQATP